MIPLKLQPRRGPQRGAFAFTAAAAKVVLCFLMAVTFLVGAPPEPRLDAPVRRMQVNDTKGLRFTRISSADGLSQTRVAQIMIGEGLKFGVDESKRTLKLSILSGRPPKDCILLFLAHECNISSAHCFLPRFLGTVSTFLTASRNRSNASGPSIMSAVPIFIGPS
jgi:hypothetical protein